MFYDHKTIEQKWQKYWQENETFKSQQPSTNQQQPKYYVLDMFPYPSGAGLHVGHPLGYIASDIYSRYKRHQGFNVLHPIGYDSFGLPAEQYAIQTGQHPAITTEQNINRYEEQLRKIGFSFDWSRELRTSDASYYKWTQWIFIQLFNSWYNNTSNKAESIETLVQHFEQYGTENLNAAQTEALSFSAEEWRNASEEDKQDILLNYRLAFRAETTVNWCPALGTVLANDEVKDGKSERGGYPVYQKKMMQWSMRITAYSERLLQGLDQLDWSDAVKDSQRNWIGKSVGASVWFPLSPEGGKNANSLISQEEAGSSEKKGKYGYMTGTNCPHLLLEKAQEMRDNPTAAEMAMWEVLKSKNLGDKFRRQHLVGDFIADFVCLSKRLIIEVDGGYHHTDEQQVLDEERTIALADLGYEVIRFNNEEVIGNIDNMIAQIQEKLSSRNVVQNDDNEVFPPSGDRGIEVFTTRPDTIFGVSFLTLAPEHELVAKITTPEQKAEVEAYVEATSKRSERERMADVKNITGAFTGAYAEHPLTKEPIPIWIGDYVLAGYGTGAVMAVPAGDERDYAFAKHFGLPIKNIFNQDISENAFSEKEGFVLENSDFLNGLGYKEATGKIVAKLEELEVGKAKINYRQRDAIFSRQRYWGEPVPIYYKDGLPYTLPVSALPLELPEVEKYLPTEDGDPPLGNAKNYAWDSEKEAVVSTDLIDNKTIFPLELSTMPGWAGSSWYFLRYMDSKNEDFFVDKNLVDYWGQVDLYIGGSEHATGHLLYSRFWNMFLYDRGFISHQEPFQKMINQGMILGVSAFVFRVNGTNQLVSKNLSKDYDTQKIPVDISLIQGNDELDIEGLRAWRPEFKDAEFILEDGKYICEREVEKMSKSKYNVVNPDDICEEYGADCLRLYEMFLGPLEQSKPWNTQGLSGVYGFLKKFYNLYFDGDTFSVSEEEPTKEEYKVLHTLIKKVVYDIEHFSFNTSVSSFMIAVNELQKLKCNKRAILEPLAVIISPYAPHICEELWQLLGHSTSIEYVKFPELNEAYLVEDEIEYPVSFNGKMKFKMKLPAELSPQEIEKIALADDRVKAQLGENSPKKIIVVPKKIINIVS
ncbi:leucine--tRNA ligase [Bergeyella porcorum]|uniref:leucine--tRNA ligase n=1 Tax=Bergeyella porcorum TaxID=1735111 RepID=UPI0035ECF8A2